MSFKLKFFPTKMYLIYFSSIFFAIGLLSRDIRLQKFLIGASNPEFQASNILCADIPRCTRISGEILGLGIQNLIRYIAEFFHGNPLWQNFYLSDTQYFSVFSKFSSITFRVVCVLPIALYFHKLFKENINAKMFSLLAFTGIFSGFPLYYLNNLFGIYLVNYDYMVIFVMGLFLNFYNQILRSKIYLVIFTIICVMTIENLPLILLVIIYFQNKKTFKRFSLMKLSSITIFVTYAILLLGVMGRNGSIDNMESDGRHYSFNLQRLPEIIGAIFIIIIWSFVLGALVGSFGLSGLPVNSLRSAIEFIPVRNIQGIILGYFISIFVGIFISILTEFARQLLFFQIMIFLFGISVGIKYLISLEARK
jgi:hypothetical protein